MSSSSAVVRATAFAFAALLLFVSCSDETPETIWNEARQAFDARDFTKAMAAMERLAKLREPTAEDNMMRGQLAIASGDADRAISLLKAVPDSHHMAAQARLQQGQIEIRRSRARFAESYIKEALVIDPKLVQAHRELIYIYGMQLRRAELAEQFRKVSELAPVDFEQAFLWCLTRGGVWEPKEIVVDMGKYIAADPEDRFSRLSLVDALRKVNNYDEAVKVLEPLSNDDPEARVLRVQLALDHGDEGEAESLLAGGPKLHLGLDLLRGRLAMARGDTKKAVDAFRSALTAEPNNRDALFGLGHSLQKLDDPEAKKYLEESNRMEKLGTLVQRASMPSMKNNPQLVRDLGAACEAAGRIPEARAWFKIATALDPLDSEAQQALFRLKSPTK